MPCRRLDDDEWPGSGAGVGADGGMSGDADAAPTMLRSASGSVDGAVKRAGDHDLTK